MKCEVGPGISVEACESSVLGTMPRSGVWCVVSPSRTTPVKFLQVRPISVRFARIKIVKIVKISGCLTYLTYLLPNEHLSQLIGIYLTFQLPVALK